MRTQKEIDDAIAEYVKAKLIVLNFESDEELKGYVRCSPIADLDEELRLAQSPKAKQVG